MTAALGVILDPETRTQVIFGGGEKEQPAKKEEKKSRSKSASKR